MYKHFFKRVADILLALIGISVFALPMVLVAIAIKIDSPGPVLFKQKRIAIHKKTFNILKFRSMPVDIPRDVPTHQFDAQNSLSKFQLAIRKFSIDELPQLFCILVGTMSFIGPRPALWNQYDLIEERDKYGANDVKPGLTGWAQINGRDELEIPLKAKLDGEYVNNLSFVFDCKCFFGTITSVLKHDGVVEGGTSVLNNDNAVNESAVNTENILVSVVVATYKREKPLYTALESLTCQTHKNIEVIIVDDNADAERNAKVKAIVDDIQNKYPELKLELIVNNLNQGSAETRNIGIRAAKGEYITFLDDDDLYLEEKISHQLSGMVEADADYSITDLNLYNESEKLVDKRVRDYINDTSPEALLTYHLLYHITGTDVMMFKREYLLKIGCFPPINVGDEYYLMKEAICGNGKFCYVPGCHIKAYVHTGEDSLSSGKGKIDGENKLYIYKKTFFDRVKPQDKRYIRMRHYAVIAYAYLRMRKYPYFAANIVMSFFMAPIACVKTYSKRN